MEPIFESENNFNPAKDNLRKVLSSEQGLKNIKRFFLRNKKVTPQGEYYDFNKDSCRGTIHKAAATLIFLAYPSNDSSMHLFPNECDQNRQQLLFNAFYRSCIPAESIVFPEREDINDPTVIINGNDFFEAKKERVEKLGASDLVQVTELLYD